MLVSNRIIVIDDNRNDLNAICDIFHKNGIGCRGFVYDPFNLPDQPLTGIRFVFIDMNLNPAGGGEIKSSLKDAIKHFISVDNGPYILIFWTNRVEEIEDFINFINRDDDDVKLKLKPLHITHIDKNEFIDSKDHLTDKIESILSSDFVKCIIKFDESVLNAATKTLNAILSTINVSDKWGEHAEFDKACRFVFSKIAESTSGLTQAKLNPDMALKESLAAIFKHVLCQNHDDYWKEYLTPLKTAEKSKDISFPDGFSLEKLNSIYHIDASRIEQKSIKNRGAVCNFSKHDNSEVFNELFHTDYQSWLDESFHDLSGVDSSEINLIAVEFSAACDFSQDKDRTNKYILGILISSAIGKKLRKANLKDYIFLIPFDFHYDNQNYTLALNLNYTFNLPKLPNILSGPLFILNKEFMDMLGLEYSSHLSRIGITSFRKK